MVEEPQFAKTLRLPKGSKGKGIRYEIQVIDAVERELPDTWVGCAGPWFEFVDDGDHRYAQPDWLGFDVPNGVIHIMEIKLTRVPQAWWQLNRLYRPLVEAVFPGWDIALVEATSMIRNVIVPEPVSLISNIKVAKPGQTQVMHLPYGC